MITGQIKNQIDQIWDTFWESAGITNPMTVLEQMTYLFFIKMLDDAQMQREALDSQLDMPHAEDDTFAYGSWHNPETGEDVPVNNLRWHEFRHLEPEAMYRTIQRDVFPYIKTLNRGEDSAYSRFMGNANFLIASPRALVKIVDDKRNPVADNDIPDIIARFHSLASGGEGGERGEADRKRTDRSFLVPADEIRSHDYDLAFNTYKETVREVI